MSHSLPDMIQPLTAFSTAGSVRSIHPCALMSSGGPTRKPFWAHAALNRAQPAKISKMYFGLQAGGGGNPGRARTGGHGEVDEVAVLAGPVSGHRVGFEETEAAASPGVEGTVSREGSTSPAARIRR